ncbi:unnamed protein product [Bursaphelenchus okinawaensis]|uniref:Ribosomal silencing factor RsfS n=1 Tax=Bursaphelenchus okinawaensis TaxID=465554 RepID=A0A811LMS3_9BILA|nr:unnamed protein product [Bursaphelenchus okinawaensis]CAG9128216.1 unnamed protein product [Bursaphelenchus okinawaensis]
MNEQIKRVQQINDYFNQYIDEYYEEEEEEIEEDVAVEQVREFSEDLAKQKLLEIPVEEVVSVLEELKAKNIEVVDIEEENAPFKQIVVASPYTARHASVLIEEVRLHFTKRYDFGKSNPSRVKNQTGWYLLDCHNLVIHIMTEENREKYQLSNLWKTKSLDEQEEDMIKEGWIPPQKPNETQKYRYQRTPVV